LVINVALPGTPALDLTDPSNDDHGPGTYAYPTAPDFAPGAFDMTRMRISQTATDVYIQVTLRTLVPTFGNSFGAQLLDLYVRNPSAATTSTAAAFPARNYATDPWSERIEVQGFASPVWVDASGTSLGNPRVVVDTPSRTATVVVPKSAFGTVGAGWGFAVALTGQDGFSPDQARSFASTPQPYQFGVCAPGGSSPICSVKPNTVPKVMDTITQPPGLQATELDPTKGPAVLHGVSVP
jgi:glucoamylase